MALADSTGFETIKFHMDWVHADGQIRTPAWITNDPNSNLLVAPGDWEGPTGNAETWGQSFSEERGWTIWSYNDNAEDVVDWADGTYGVMWIEHVSG